VRRLVGKRTLRHIVYFSAMKKIAFILALISVLGCDNKNKDSAGQSGDLEWIPLFNGKDLEGWTPKIRYREAGENFGNTFRVSGNELQVSYDSYEKFNETFGHIFYKDKFSSYVLNIEYKFFGEQCNEGPEWAIRNSGVMLHCQEPSTMHKDQDFPISIEVQFLGGNGEDERTTANLCTPGTNVVMDGKLVTYHCISSSSPTFHGDQWVNVRILVLGDSLIRHVIGGKTVLEYQQPQLGGGAVTHADTTIFPPGKLLNEGYISLQSESHPVAFRKVELLDLSPVRNDRTKLETAITKALNDQ
jgi:hypothetical protein